MKIQLVSSFIAGMLDRGICLTKDWFFRNLLNLIKNGRIDLI